MRLLLAANRITRPTWKRWKLNIVPWAMRYNTHRNDRLTAMLLRNHLTVLLLRLKPAKDVRNKLTLLRLMPLIHQDRLQKPRLLN